MRFTKVERDWGTYTILFKTKWLVLKALRFNSSSRLSHQKHKLRSELWFCWRNPCGLIHVGGSIKPFPRFTFRLIKRDTWHHFVNFGGKGCLIFELQYGSIVTETDIIREDY